MQQNLCYTELVSIYYSQKQKLINREMFKPNCFCLKEKTNI